MMHAPSCESFNDRLMDYLERETDDATRVAMEAHAATCRECAALLADIRTLRNDAANLPELAPARDLWSGIAARIETPVVPIGAAATAVATPARGRRRRWMNVGLMAASLAGAVAIGYGLRGESRELADVRPAMPTVDTVVIAPPAQDVADARFLVGPDAAGGAPRNAPRSTSRSTSRTAPATTVAAAPAAPPPGRPVDVQLAVATLTADYDREIAALRVLIDQRRAQLDPVTIGVIEKNLAVIDTAIAESRRAIANDPSGAFLIEFLNQSLQAKVELMRTAALLPSRT